MIGHTSVTQEVRKADLFKEAFKSPFESLSTEDLEALLKTVFEPSEPFLPPQEDLDIGLENATEGVPIVDLWADIHSKIIQHAVHTRHPAAMAHMTPPPASVSILADLIIGSLNQCAFIWEQAPVAKLLETEVITWLARKMGLREHSTGLLTSGGTLSNCLAVYLAIDEVRQSGADFSKLCIIASDQAHISLNKAAAWVGLPTENLHRVATDGNGRLRPGDLERTAQQARSNGLQPFLFVCTAGTSNTGTIEPASEFLAAARQFKAWCHVDAAHGGLLALSSEPRQAVADWRQADSISWDPHKSMYVSYAVGALLLSDRNKRDPLRFHCEYALKKGELHDAGELHLEGSRRLEALKLWMTIKHFGSEGFARMTDHCLDLARYLAIKLQADEGFEWIHQPDTNVICFRVRDCSSAKGQQQDEVVDQLQIEVQKYLYRRGGPLLSCTQVGGRPVLRAVLLNPLLDQQGLDECLEKIRRTARALCSASSSSTEAPAETTPAEEPVTMPKTSSWPSWNVGERSIPEQE